jgi:hypothetical protein
MIVAAATLWGLVTMSFLLDIMRAPRLLCRTAPALLALEGLALLVWSYGREGCVEASCGAGTAVARAAAFEDIPALSLVFILATLVHARRAWRRRIQSP